MEAASRRRFVSERAANLQSSTQPVIICNSGLSAALEQSGFQPVNE
jgi:hypothetical protein